MKAFIAFLLLSGLAAHAQAGFDCTQYEAQFIGKVKSIEKKGDSCIVKASFRFFNESQICPLDMAQVMVDGFEPRSCDLKLDDEISGILVEKDGRIFVE